MSYLAIQPPERALASAIFANAQRLQGAFSGGFQTTETRARALLNVRMVREAAERLEAELSHTGCGLPA